MRDSIHTIAYAAVLAVVCALLLTGAAQFTEPYRKRNAEAEEMRNVLAVLHVPFDPEAPSQELVDVFKKNVREEDRNGLKMYVYSPPEARGSVLAVAVAFSGQGLWGPIKGFLSLEPDMRTIRGIAFHEQEETPGLGGEISSKGFRDRFRGKVILDGSGAAGIRITTDRADAPNEVDAITGATMTCKKVEVMLNKTIKRIIEELNKNGQ